ncbi:MAG: DUF3179 domain-containing protein [Neomegalonema sp.]|nr:DUF3179 domain-containing protein [Neomegalonema sp.]
MIINTRRIAPLLFALSSFFAMESALAKPATPPPGWKSAWPKTDFSKSSIDYSEIFDGGPAKDGIPAIDTPAFIPIKSASGIGEREPIVSVKIGGEARAYPIRYLIWHEIVNDEFGKRKVTITFCPLCNSAIVFDGTIGERSFTFGVSGKLRKSDMIMYDRQTESWWQQFTGEAIVGEMLGAKLKVIPSVMESWAEFKAANPGGLVMARPTAYLRAYGRNPYRRYDSSSSPFLYRGENPPHGVPALARVVRIKDRAWPLSRLRKRGELSEAGVKLTWRKGQASALDTADIGKGKDVGTVRAFDAKTGAPIAYEVIFAFVFHAFEPKGIWMLGK